MSFIAAVLTIAPSLFVLRVEPNHSTIGFAVPIAADMTRVTGKFTRFEMRFLFEPNDNSSWEIEAQIDAASVDTGNDERDADLRGGAFFDVERHPTISFASRRVEKRGEAFVAHGTLTMCGVSRDVDLPFRLTRVEWEDGLPRAGVAAALSLDRTEFGVGVDWRHSLIPEFLGEEVEVEIFLWTKRGEPVTPPNEKN